MVNSLVDFYVCHPLGSSAPRLVQAIMWWSVLYTFSLGFEFHFKSFSSPGVKSNNLGEVVNPTPRLRIMCHWFCILELFLIAKFGLSIQTMHKLFSS